MSLLRNNREQTSKLIQIRHQASVILDVREYWACAKAAGLKKFYQKT